jgi:hypothetical protein
MGNCNFLEVTQQRVNVLTVNANGKQRIDVIFAEGAHVASNVNTGGGMFPMFA